MPTPARDNTRFLNKLQPQIPEDLWGGLYQDVHGMFGLQGAKETWTQILEHNRSNLTEWMCLLFRKYPHQVATTTLDCLMDYCNKRPEDLRSQQTQRDIWCQLAAAHINQSQAKDQGELRKAELKVAHWLAHNQPLWTSLAVDNENEDVLDYLFFYVPEPKIELIQFIFDHCSLEAINQSQRRAQELESSMDMPEGNMRAIAELTQIRNTKEAIVDAIGEGVQPGRAVKKM